MNLTETAYYTRRGVGIFLALVVATTVGRIAWGIGYPLYRRFFPPEKPPPEVGFGELPELNLRSLPLKAGSSPTYSLDTITGELPSFPDRLPVFPMSSIKPSPLSGQKAEELARGLGFEGAPKMLSANQYVWKDEDRVLGVNIGSGNFSLETKTSVLGNQLTPGTAPGSQGAKRKAFSFLSSHDLLSEDVENGKQKILLTQIRNNLLRRALSLSEAQLTRVDFFWEVKVGETTYPLLGPNPQEGLIWVAVTGERKKREIPLSSYTYWPVEKQGSTYPLKSGEEAWKELKDGGGAISYLRLSDRDPYASYNPLDLKRVSVREIYLAYFMSQRPQKYLQPIYVFEGEAETTQGKKAQFTAYLPAVEYPTPTP